MTPKHKPAPRNVPLPPGGYSIDITEHIDIECCECCIYAARSPLDLACSYKNCFARVHPLGICGKFKMLPLYKCETHGSFTEPAGAHLKRCVVSHDDGQPCMQCPTCLKWCRPIIDATVPSSPIPKTGKE